MKIVCETDYQDIYRLKEGVLLVVNKFKYIANSDGKYDFISAYSKNKPYAKECQNQLRILTDDFYCRYSNTTYKEGQVLYRGYPVELVGENDWEYQIKTTGDAFSGDAQMIYRFIEEISKYLRTGVDEDVCKD